MGKAAEGDRRETWRDWQDARAPEPPLLTRTEVLLLLEHWQIERGGGGKVEERTLRYWEKEGLIPRPTREHRGGVTRTWYPSWVPDLVAILRRRQDYGAKLNRLRDELRAEARRLSTDPRPHPFAPPQAGDGTQWGRYRAEHAARLLDGPRYAPPNTFDPPTLPDWNEGLITYDMALAIRAQYQYHRFATTRLEVRLLDAQGRDRTYVIPLPADFDLDPVGTSIAAALASVSSADHDAAE